MQCDKKHAKSELPEFGTLLSFGTKHGSLQTFRNVPKSNMVHYKIFGTFQNQTWFITNFSERSKIKHGLLQTFRNVPKSNMVYYKLFGTFQNQTWFITKFSERSNTGYYKAERSKKFVINRV
jgi:hypothetical protein